MPSQVAGLRPAQETCIALAYGLPRDERGKRSALLASIQTVSAMKAMRMR